MRERWGLYQRRSELLPGGDHPLLIAAATLGGDNAAAAWSAWSQAHGPLAEMEGAGLRLLPAIAQNLGGRLAQGPDGQRLAGITRHTWAQNQITLALLAPLLTEADRPPLIAAGSGAALAAPGGLRARALDPVELLVAPGTQERTERALRAAGLRRSAGDGDGRGAGHRRAPASYPGRWTSGRFDILLAAEPLPVPSDGETPHRESRRLILDGPEIELRLPPSEQLVVAICVKATFTAGRDPLWVVDVARLIRGAGDSFDWDRLRDYARREQVRFPVLGGLAVLGELTGVRPPEGLREKLASPQPSARERLAGRLISGPPRLPKLRWYAHRSWNGPPQAYCLSQPDPATERSKTTPSRSS